MYIYTILKIIILIYMEARILFCCFKDLNKE